MEELIDKARRLKEELLEIEKLGTSKAYFDKLKVLREAKENIVEMIKKKANIKSKKALEYLEEVKYYDEDILGISLTDPSPIIDLDDAIIAISIAEEGIMFDTEDPEAIGAIHIDDEIYIVAISELKQYLENKCKN